MPEKKQEKKIKKDLSLSIGQKLKKAREAGGMSVDEAHKATRIHPRIINSLESDKYEDELGPTYLKSFLKTYSSYLGLDTPAILEEYNKVKQPPEDLEMQTVQARSRLHPAAGERVALGGLSFSFLPVAFAVIGIVFWIAIFLWATANFKSHYAGDRQEKAGKAVVGQTAGSAAQRRTGRGASYATKTNAESENFISVPARRNITATLTTKRDLWIKVTQDGTVAFHGTLSKTTKETWRANDELILSEIGRPEAFTLNVNGKEIDFTGRKPPRRIIITRKGLTIDPR